MKGLREKFKDEPLVNLYEAAFHVTDGEAPMYTPDDYSESSSLYAEKKTSPGKPIIAVKTIDGPAFLRELSPGPIVLFSNCEGSEFDFVPVILEDPALLERIKLWSVSFHHGQCKIPTLRPAYEELYPKMVALGVNNLDRHYGRRSSFDAQKQTFVDEIMELSDDYVE
jgi:hypothetical protein